MIAMRRGDLDFGEVMEWDGVSVESVGDMFCIK